MVLAIKLDRCDRLSTVVKILKRLKLLTINQIKLSSNWFKFQLITSRIGSHPAVRVHI